MRRLGGRFRVITFDKRGTGLSDRIVQLPGFETLMDDVRAVLAAAGSQRTILLGLGPTGGGACAVFAGSFPERTCAFLWWAAAARWTWAPDNPWGDRDEDLATSEQWHEESWGDDGQGGELLRDYGGPSSAGDPEAQRWFAKYLRYAAGPGDAVRMNRLWDAVDVRGVLPAIHVSTLCVPHHDLTGPEEAAWIAEQIPGAVCAA
jgi:pimeloyl-ACP methyl ester carboxylesterase